MVPGVLAAELPGPRDFPWDPRQGLVAVVILALGLTVHFLRRRPRRSPGSPPSPGGSLRAIRLDSAGIESVLRERLPDDQIPGAADGAAPVGSGMPSPSPSPPTSGTAAGPPAVFLRRASTVARPAAVPAQALLVERPAFSLVDQVYRLEAAQVMALFDAIHRKDGFDVTRPEPDTPAGRIDLVASRDGERTAIQCRHWMEGRVGTNSVQNLADAMQAAGIARGLLLSLKGYTFEARTLAQRFGIRILDKPDILLRLEEARAAIDPELIRCFEPIAASPTA